MIIGIGQPDVNAVSAEKPFDPAVIDGEREIIDCGDLAILSLTVSLSIKMWYRGGVKNTGFGVMAGSEERFETFVERLAEAVGHADRREPLRAYCTELMLPGRRKSIEPMAARLAPKRVGAAHQSLHHLVAKAPWSDAAVLAAVRAEVVPTIEAHRRSRADQVLVLDAGRGNLVEGPRRARQPALAHRARLSGTQATDRPRPLRRPRLARLSPPRKPVYRGLRNGRCLRMSKLLLWTLYDRLISVDSTKFTDVSGIEASTLED